MVDSPSPARRALWVGVAVVGIVALAFFLRAYWNVQAAHPDGSTFVLSGGSDPYYHKRAVDCIVYGDVNGDCGGSEAWTHFLRDPFLNYPFGSINPNPPLYQWSIAVMGAALDPIHPGTFDEALWWATITSPAIWGALAVLPIYFLGRELWSRKAGLIAAFFWAVSTTSIDHTSLGDADHDAMLMFFAVLSFLFYVKMLNAFRGNETWVTSWGSGSSIAAGIGRLWRERGVGIAYAGLSGMSIAAVALIWKGFPYLLGILLIYGGIVLLVDNWRNRDSLGVFLGTTLVFALALAVAYPYYKTAGLIAANFYAPLAMLVAWLVASVVLVPTRDLPFILILPSAIVSAAIGALGIYFLSPVAWRSLFNATVYFRQSQLYQTIAEAHPADFNTMVFGIGPVVFLLAIVGLGWLAFSLRKEGRRPLLFALIWGVVALYMAHAAVRFLFNAVPILVLVAGAFTARILEWVNFGTMRREFAGAGSFWGGMRRALRAGQVVAALLLALVLVLPQVVLAFDAAVPFNVESKWQRDRLEDWLLSNGYNQTTLDAMPVEGQDGLKEAYIQKRLSQEDVEDTSENRQKISREFIFFVERRMGAFGQGFLDASWQRSLAFLDDYSAENWSGPVDERPAFLAWWDYGHWAIAVGNVPTVADNFQNGYQFAANFLLAQNENHAIQLLAARLLPCVGGCGSNNLAAQLTVVKNALPTATEDDVRNLLAWKQVTMTDDQAVRLVMAVEKETGKKIRYFTVDGRMMPLDDPQTSGFIDRSSIYYAPVILKGESADKYLETKYSVSGCGFAEVNDSGLEKCVKNPAQSANVQVTGQKLEYKRAFVNSMYYRGFVGTPVPGAGVVTNQQVLQAFYTAQPGFNLKHFRAIYADSEVRILEFYPGVNLTGTVVDDTGAPVANAVVKVYDDINGQTPGVQHGETRTNAAGRWTLIAPFSTGPGVTVDVTKDNVKVANATIVVPHVSARELAANGSYVEQPVAPLVVQKGTVRGSVFHDVDADGTKDANESVVKGLTFKIGNRDVTTDADGNYTLDTLAGEASVTTANATYTFRLGTSVRIEPSKTTTQSLGAIYRPVNVTGTLTMSDRPATNFSVPLPTLTFVADTAIADNTARNASATVQTNGTYSVTLTPGAYKVRITPSPYLFRPAGATESTPYVMTEVALVVPVAGAPITRDFALTVQT